MMRRLWFWWRDRKFRRWAKAVTPVAIAVLIPPEEDWFTLKEPTDGCQ